MKITLVPPEYVVQVWPKVRPHMVRAAEYTYGRYTAEDMLESVANGSHQLWLAYEGDEVFGGVATCFTYYPRCKALSMDFTGGERLVDWKDDMLFTLRQWARDHGCDRIECSGRPGWARIFSGDGHKPLWQSFELPVVDNAADVSAELEMSDGR